MESSPQEVVRSIRLALGMTQAEFARALGWSTTTISRWESGRALPNRLALKIILAFGEEHHVRLRRGAVSANRAGEAPLPVTTALTCLTNPLAVGAAPRGTLIAPPGGGTLDWPEPESPGDWTRGGRRELSGPALSRTAGLERPAADDSERPAWQAEVRFRLSGPSRADRTGNLGSWFRGVVLLAGTLVVLAALGMPIVRGFGPDGGDEIGRDAARRAVTRAGVGLPPPESVGTRLGARPARSGPTTAPLEERAGSGPAASGAGSPIATRGPAAADQPGPDPVSDETPDSGQPKRLTMGQLAGVLLAGGARRVTVRTPSGSMIFTEGDRVGEGAIARVAPDRIEFREGSGRSRVVRLGESLPLE
ncbi:MAG TPA: helix-turn-helix domain-containing protein [Candidatus Bathyarchaeia archaeon]|nr:helix-turn-helix domain-containing protein [Candidatus Bathyarchaeia archaeon]